MQFTALMVAVSYIFMQVLAAQHRALRQAAEAGRLPAALGYLSSTGASFSGGAETLVGADAPRPAGEFLAMVAARSMVALPGQLKAAV